MDFLSRLFDPSGFVPRSECGEWTVGLVLLHNVSDGLIWLSYVAIPLVLVYFVRRRKDIPFPWMFWLFGAFIFSCGSTHFLEVVMFYDPLYRLAGVVKAVTALASVGTVVALLRVVPRAMALRSPGALDREVVARTAEPARANDALRREVEQRRRAEQTLLEERERFRLTLASIGDGVLATDGQGRVTFLNGVACSLTGWSPEDAQGRPVEEVFRVVSEGTRRPVESPADQALREGTAAALSNSAVLIARDGTERPIDCCGAAMRDAGGLAGAVLVFRDVGERRQCEEVNARLAAIVESSEDAVIGKSLDGTITSWNAGAERLFGYAAREVLGQPISLLAPPGRLDEMPGILDRLRRGERVEPFETVRVRKDGSPVDVSLSVSPVKDAEGRVVGAAKIARDVTARKRADEALRQQAEQLRLQADLLNLSDALVRDPDGRITTWTDGMARLYGWTRAQAEGRVSHELLRTRFPRPLEEINAQMSRAGRWEGELTHVRPDGAEVVAASLWVVHRDAAGTPVRVLEVHNDITALKRAEVALRRIAGLLQAVADETTDAVFVKDRQGRYLLFNGAAARFVGKPVADVLGRDDAELFDPDGARLAMERDRRVMETGRAETEEEVLTAAGVTRAYLSMKAPYRDARGAIIGTIGISRDITDRKRAEEALARDALLLANVRDSVFIVTDLNGIVTYWNEGAVRLYGWTAEEVVGRRYADRFPEPVRSLVADQIRARTDGSEWSGEYEDYRKDGSRVWIEARVSRMTDAAGRPAGVLGLAHDISDRKRAEAERDAVLGRLRMQIERMPLAYITFDADLRISDWNPAAEKTFGFRKEEVLGREPAGLIGPPDVLAQGGEELLRRLRAGDMDAHGFYANRTKDGRTIVCQWFNTPLMDGDGRFTGLLCLAQDVTDRIAAEEALRLRDRAIQAVTQGILITDPRLPDNPIVYASPGFEQVTGYAAEEVVGRNCRFLQGPDTDASTVALVREAVHKSRPCSVEILNYRKDGTAFWNSLSLSPVRDAEGTVTHFVGVQADVTERKRSEESLARLATIVESSEDAIVSVTPDGTVVSWNPGAERLFGYSAGEMVGHGAETFIPPEHLEAARAVKERVLRGEHVASFEAGRRHQDGRTLHTSVTLSAVRDAGGRIVGVSGISRDISRQRAAEEALRQSEEQFRGAFDYTGVAMVLTDTDNRFVRVNAAFARMFGYSPPEMLGMTMAAVTHPDDLAESYAGLNQLLAGESHFFLMEKRYLHRDGHSIWGLTNTSLVRDPDGQPLLYVGQVQDVTDRKRTEQRLRTEHAVGSIFAQAPDLPEAAPKLLRAVCETTGWDVGALWVMDRQANVLSCVDLWHVESVAVAEFSDLSRHGTCAPEAGLPGRVLAAGQPTWVIDITREPNFPRAAAAARAGLRGGFAFPIQFGNDILGVAEFFSRESRQPDEELVRMFASLGSLIGQFIERKRMEEGLRLFRALIDQTLDLIEVIDPETGRFLDVNERACVSHGYTREEYLTLGVSDVDPQVASRPWGELNAERRLAGAQSFESQHQRKDGSTFPVEVILNFIHLDRDYVVAVVRDITERRQLEEQFRQAQKMEAVGQLAGGVAHDFNNLLQVIMGYGDLLLGTLRPDDPSRELVGEMTRAGERAAGLTRQLLAFGRQSVVALRVLVLNSVVLDLEKMLRRVIGEDIDLRTALQPGLGHVKADPGQIEQVLMNLAVNARDAMPEGGKLTIETRDAELDEEYARLHAGVRPGTYVLLAVSDTGHGMTAEVQARVFEPFFTTKEKGRGTGLGLSTVFGIVQQAAGHVAVYSEPGVGTSFKVYLPRVEETASSAEPHADRTPASRGVETVLLVEDEDAVRTLICIVLRGQGYTVLEASDGGEALDIAGRHEGPIHLLLSDVVMPVLGGRQLAERMLALQPEMKVLFQSGYTDDAVVRHGVLQEKVHFLQKPFTPAALVRKVREVLESPQ